MPSFILALETNRDRLKGKFILNVIRMCIPAALTMTANILALCALGGPFGLTHPEMSHPGGDSHGLYGLYHAL